MYHGKITSIRQLKQFLKVKLQSCVSSQSHAIIQIIFIANLLRNLHMALSVFILLISFLRSFLHELFKLIFHFNFKKDSKHHENICNKLFIF